MYINHLSAFTSFLCESKRTLEEIARYLALHVFQELHTCALLLGKLGNDRSLDLKSSFGIDGAQADLLRKISLDKNLPITEVIKNGSSLFANSRSDVIAKYPEMEELFATDNHWGGCIAIPAHNQGSLMLLVKGLPDLNHEFEHFLKALGNLLSIELENSPNLNRSRLRDAAEEHPLSTRQELIRQFLAKGFTNAHIAQEIGYSESLVRQETIAIYSALQISGRKDLIDQKRSMTKKQA